MKPYFESSDVTIWNADAREASAWLPEDAVDAIVTSPPYYGLRDYAVDGQLGLEDDVTEYVTTLADLLTSYADRVMKPEGSLWLNLGDSYATRGHGGNPGNSSAQVSGNARRRSAGGADRRSDGDFSADRPREKSLWMVPERVVLALMDGGWIVRNRVVWAKPNGMPSSATDRLANKHEALFHLVRQTRYYYDLDAIREPFAESSLQRGRPHRADHTGARGDDVYPAGVRGQTLNAKRYLESEGANPGDVWTIPTHPYPEAHFAVFPQELVRRPILATVPEGGLVLDPFFGSGTTGVMARRLGRRAWGVELNPDYCALAASRFQQEALTFTEVPA